MMPIEKPPCTLRRAEKSDAPALFELLTELSHFEHLEAPNAAAKERLLQDGWGEKKRFDAYLAFVDESEAPVGFCILFETYSTFLARPRLFVEDLYVRPDFRGRGIGKALISLCLEEAVARGCWRVECMGLDWNDKAQDIYEKLGARQLHEWFLFRFERPVIERHTGIGPKRRHGRRPVSHPGD
jgi:GNAT superfamily N-acetyltransferase